MLKKTLITLALVLTLTAGIATAQYGDNSPEAQAALTMLTATDEFQQLVSDYPNYSTFIEREENEWLIEVFAETEDDEIWLGAAWIDATTLEILGYETADGEDEQEEMEITPEIQIIIDTIAATEDFAANLAQYPGYQSFAYEEGNEYVLIGFFASDGEDEEIFLGEAFVQRDNMQIVEAFVPVFLSPDEIAQRTPEIIAIAEADMAVASMIAELELTNPQVEYEPDEQTWVVFYEQGYDFYEVILGADEEAMTGLMVLDVRVFSEFDEAEREQLARDEAITLAFEADALANIDLPEDWFTRITPLGANLYGVDFITEDVTLIVQVIVDINQQQIIEVIEQAS
ncbi:MAG: hypothetical protein AAF787_14180 [Chloroflexota bacterium]